MAGHSRRAYWAPPPVGDGSWRFTHESAAGCRPGRGSERSLDAAEGASSEWFSAPATGRRHGVPCPMQAGARAHCCGPTGLSRGRHTRCRVTNWMRVCWRLQPWVVGSSSSCLYFSRCSRIPWVCFSEACKRLTSPHPKVWDRYREIGEHVNTAHFT